MKKKRNSIPGYEYSADAHAPTPEEMAQEVLEVRKKAAAVLAQGKAYNFTNDDVILESMSGLEILTPDMLEQTRFYRQNPGAVYPAKKTISSSTGAYPHTNEWKQKRSDNQHMFSGQLLVADETRANAWHKQNQPYTAEKSPMLLARAGGLSATDVPLRGGRQEEPFQQARAAGQRPGYGANQPPYGGNKYPWGNVRVQETPPENAIVHFPSAQFEGKPPHYVELEINRAINIVNNKIRRLRAQLRAGTAEMDVYNTLKRHWATYFKPIIRNGTSEQMKWADQFEAEIMNLPGEGKFSQ